MTSRKGGSARRSAPRARPPAAPAPPEPPARSAPLGRVARLGVVLALFGIWLVVFAPTLGGQLTFVRGDAGRYSAFADFSRARFETTGERTFWNPYVFLGLPTAGSLADPRPQWLPDPLLRAWDALTRTSAGTPLWPPLLACLCGAIGAAWLARALWACGAAGMTLTGGLWLLAPGLLVPLAFGHDAQTTTTALMPLTLLAAHAVLAAPTTAGMLASALAFALSLAAQALGGHPQFVVYTGVALAPFAIERSLAYGRRSRLAVLGGATVLAAAMSAGAWLPALFFGAHAQRADAAFAAREARIFSLMPRDLLALVWPRAVGYADAAYWGGMRGTDYSHALGVVAAALAVLGLLARGQDRRAARVWGALALLGMLCSLGRNLPGLGALVQSLPVFGSFRTPMTWLVLAVLAGAVLAGRGLNALATGGAPAWGFRGAIACLALGALALVAQVPLGEAWLGAAQAGQRDRAERGLVSQAAAERFAATAPEAASRAARELGIELLLAGASLGAFVLARRRGDGRARSAAAAAVSALALVPLASIVVPTLRAATGPRQSLRAQPPPPLARAAAADPLHRAMWLDRERVYSNDWVAWRARQVGGLSGAVSARWDAAARADLFMEPRFLRACAVRYVGLSGDTLTSGDTALPRAYAVPRVRAVPDAAAAIDAMRDPAWDPAAIAIAVAAADREFPGSAALAIRWERDDPDRQELRLRSAAPAFLVVADAEFPGWTARLDGVRVDIERVDLVLRGVTIPAGEHRLSLDYVPEGWTLARVLSIAAWAAACAGLVALAAARIVRPRVAPMTPSG